MAAVIDAVLNRAEIKRRVAASQSKLRAAAQDVQARNAQLLQVLEAVEKTLVHNQQHIRRLEEKHGRTLEEFQHLRDLLQDRQIGPSRLLRRCFSAKSYAARADLIVRLDGLISAMTQVGEDPDGDATNERDIVPLRPHRGLVLILLNLVLWLPVKALVAIFGSIGMLIAEALVARKANSGMPLHLITRKKARRQVGGAHVRLV